MVNVDRNSTAYKCGRFFAKGVIFVAGLLLGKRLWRRRPLDDFPEKK
jgi:hypothetical protein